MTRDITVLSDLNDLNDLLRGATVDQARVVPDQGRLQLVIDITRAMIEREPVETGRGPFKRARVPWAKSRLVLRCVTTTEVKRMLDAPPTDQPLLVCDAVLGGYQLTVQAPDGLQLTVGLERLDGAFTDVGDVIVQ